MAALTACSSGAAETPAGEVVPVCTPGAEISRQAERAACGYERGASAADTLEACRIPVEHIVVLVQENRSFDHYLGRLPESGRDDVEVPPKGASNPAATPGADAVPWHHLDELCTSDTAHSWVDSHTQWGQGENDGFVVTNEPAGERGMGYYDESDLPFYYSLASTFAIADHYHSDVLGSTFPNRMYLYAGSSFGLDHNGIAPPGTRTIFHELNDRGISWKVYHESEPESIMFLDFIVQNPTKFVDFAELAKDAATGQLPAVSWIDGRTTGGALEDDEHPPGDVQVGQRFTHDVLDTVMKSSGWPSTVVFLTYDEHGGFYDHVPPPAACPPDDIAPIEHPELGGFDRYGFRVPLYVVSPFARAHHVSHGTHSHASILRFIEARFGIPALSDRDANADAMLDLFDFEHPAFMTPPALAEAPIDQDKLDACLVAHPE